MAPASQLGRRPQEGVPENDQYQPKRFYPRLSDESLLEFAHEVFEVLDFHQVQIDALEGWNDQHFQSLTRRRD